MVASAVLTADDYVIETRSLSLSLDLLALMQQFPDDVQALLHTATPVTDDHHYDLLFTALTPVTIDTLAQVDVSQQRLYADHQLPFVGGYVFFFPYEYAQQIEPSLQLPGAQDWSAMAWQVGAAFIYNKQSHQLSLVLHRAQLTRQAYYWQTVDTVLGKHVDSPAIAAQLTEDDEQQFLAGVERCRQYILAGDVFQVNLSRQWRANLDEQVTPIEIYARLRASNPAPFSALLQWDNQAIISSSPERMISVKQGRIATRPIGGTRRRDVLVEQDEALKVELRLHPKEQSEHVMLLDLERNDLGRVCVPGSVMVDELMVIESYAHVHHIVSNITGQLAKSTNALQAMNAVFPGGTITGCPKVRCMHIIAELEQRARGVYTGSLGYVSLDGQLDSNILIRSFYWQPGQLTFNAGAGVVYDSQAEAELAETRHKAKGLLAALQGQHHE